MKTRRLLSATSIVSTLTLLANTAAMGQVLNQNIRDDAEIILQSDINDFNDNGGLILTKGSALTKILEVTNSGELHVYGAIFDGRNNDGTVNIGENLSVSGNISTNDNIFVGGFIRDPNEGGTVQIADPLLVSGATGSEISLNVVGQTTLDATTIAGTTSISGVTSINTTGTAATSIGNAGTNTTIVGTTSVTGATSINTTSGAANTTIGVAANTTSILSTNVVVGNATTSSSISVGTGSAANTVTMGNGASATAVTASAGNTTMAMRNGSITNTVTASAGVSAETVVANNGSTRWVADANGKLTEVAGSDNTSGTTAAMVVTNSSGNTHGVVVQETKTTLSGGTNSSSLTLDERGATFSNSATGHPIQVHGVADGTAPFDAVNVRQLYSGLASVLAAAPDLRLEPGKSGFGIGLGSYGGYQAIGVGFGHMSDNGLVLTGSISRGDYSKTAAKASLSWNW